MTLDEIKDRYAKVNDYDNWRQLEVESGISNDDLNTIALEYAIECCRASLHKAAEEAQIEYVGSAELIVDRNSITKPNNIILL